MAFALLAPIELSRRLASALSSIRRNEISASNQQALAACRNEIADKINSDPNERDGILRALASAEQSLSNQDLKMLSSGEAAIRFIQPPGGSFRAEVAYAQAVPYGVIEHLVLGAAPEFEEQLREIWKEHNPEFVVVPDSPGITLKARDTDKRIIYNLKTLRIFALLGHAAWRVFVCHCPQVLMNSWTGKPIDAEMMWKDKGFLGARDAFEEFLQVVQDAIKADSAAQIKWPGDLVDLTADPSILTTEQRAIRDLSLMALAYAFLHEIRHTMFRHPAEAKLAEPAEELACDVFARDALLERADAYVAKSGEPINLVLAKRAAAISLGAFTVYELTAPEHRRGSSKYPPFADRFDALIARVPLPEDSYFWVFAATLLLATLRRQNYTAAVHAATPRELCNNLIALIREQAWVRMPST